MINPTIARQAIQAADARFEPCLFGNAAYSRDETAALTGASAVSKVLTGELGVALPLRTGGSVTLSMPLSRAEIQGAERTYGADASLSISHPLLRGAGLAANTHAIRIAHC